MRKNFLLYLSLALILVLATLHTVAIQLHFYWIYWWFDILTHFLGGLWAGFTFIWLFFFSGLGREKEISTGKIFVKVILSVLVLAFLWELFELVLRENLTEPNYLSDTILDMIMGLSGAVIASTIVSYIYSVK